VSNRTVTYEKFERYALCIVFLGAILGTALGHTAATVGLSIWHSWVASAGVISGLWLLATLPDLVVASVRRGERL